MILLPELRKRASGVWAPKRCGATWLLVAVSCASLSGCVRRVPGITGTIVDGRTGEPVSGALVASICYRGAEVSLVDTQAPRPVAESRRQVNTDAHGHFTLPGQWLSDLDRIEWVVFKPGLMPDRRWYRKPGWRSYKPGSHSLFMPGMNDPWTQTAPVEKGGHIEMTVRLLPPTTEGIIWPYGTTWTEWSPATGKHDLVKRFPEDVDPWGEYFKRIKTLVDHGFLPVETFVEQVGEFAAKYPVSDGVIGLTYEVRLSLGHRTQFGTFYKPDQALILLGIEEEYCRDHRDRKRCAPEYLAAERQRLTRQVTH